MYMAAANDARVAEFIRHTGADPNLVLHMIRDKVEQRERGGGGGNPPPPPPPPPGAGGVRVRVAKNRFVPYPKHEGVV